MITGTREDGTPLFIIGTPTKCATTTIEGVAKRHMRNSKHPEWFRIMDWEQPRRQHRMALPPGEEWQAADRYLLVRNPYRRYMSVYEYLRAYANYSQWGARWVQGREWPGLTAGPWSRQNPMNFGEFLLWLAHERRNTPERPPLDSGAAYRSPWVWTDSLDMSQRFLREQPGGGRVVRLIHLESLWDDLAALLGRYNIPSGGRHGVDLGVLRSNRTTKPHLGLPHQEWRKVGCAGGVFLKTRGKDGQKKSQYQGPVEGGCGLSSCGACQVGVHREAMLTGYA